MLSQGVPATTLAASARKSTTRSQSLPQFWLTASMATMRDTRMFVRMSLRGVRDKAEIRGYCRTYIDYLLNSGIARIMHSSPSTPSIRAQDPEELRQEG